MGLGLIFREGDLVGKHKLIRPIGRGGYGQVWLAHDQNIDKEVAVKLVDDTEATVDEHLREARYGNRLNHTNLVKVHYADVVDHGSVKLAAITMDYHPKGSLLSNLGNGNIIEMPRVIRYGLDMLRGLGYLHELGMIHGDIKPSNVLIGEHDQAALTDYGVTCHSPSGAPVPFRDAYRPHVAPEILNHKTVVTLTDIYQLGLTLFRLLNGIGTIKAKKAKLGDAAFFELVKKGKVVTKGDWSPYVPTRMRSIIMKAIAVDPTKRYQSALDMQRDLEKLNFQGYWCMNAKGEYEGHTDRHLYSFEFVTRPSGVFDFIAYREKKHTGNKNKVWDFSSKGLSRPEAVDIHARFFQFVVTGKDT